VIFSIFYLTGKIDTGHSYENQKRNNHHNTIFEVARGYRQSQHLYSD